MTTVEQIEAHQWCWPDGWAPLNWLVVSGLERYGYAAEARNSM